MVEAEWLVLVNGIIGLLLVISEIIGWSNCQSNSITEYLFEHLIKCNKCIGRGDCEHQT